MKTKLLVSLLLTLPFAMSSQCTPEVDFGGSAFDYFPNPDDGETFDDGVQGSAYSDAFEFIFPDDAGAIDPSFEGLGLAIDSVAMPRLRKR